MTCAMSSADADQWAEVAAQAERRAAAAERERDQWKSLSETQGAANKETLAALAEAADALDAATARERAAREALLTIRQATNLTLPSEQTGEEWERTVRVPLARLQAIDAAVASVLGEPPLTGEPMPKLHGGED